ncbi:MAG TPA: beta-ketoacyl synthase N-terminal-like domain-containing protein [Polyangiales bacterium]|nr:beta-ketoacyl synthase N-terminal-like domain-containing protein [Polyangiales bacterium]
MKPLAVTGLGVVSPFGTGRSAFGEALGNARASAERVFSSPHGVLRDGRFERARLAEVPDFDAAQYLGDKGLRNLDRATKMLVVAAKLALEDAGLKTDGAFTSVPSERVGICAATAYGSLDSITEINRVAELEHPRYLNPSRFPNTVINAAAGYVSIWEGLEGPNVTVVDGNCGGADVVLTAQTHLACGRADALLVGGFEVLNEPLYLAFEKLGVVSEGDSISAPGVVASRGTHLGEGAALVVVEPLRRARERGAHVHAELVGYGTAFEPPTSAAQLVHASDEAVERAVRSALRDAALDADAVDLVLCAESGVNLMDLAEEEGLARVFGSDLATIALKGLWGETFGAAAALGVAASLVWLAGVEPAPLLRGELRRPVRTVLVTAMGYYGNVSAVILKKASAQ